MDFVKKNNAQLFLFINAFLWGSSYVWSKMLLAYLPRFTILFICSAGGLLVTFMLFRHALKTLDAKTVMAGMLISCFSILSNTCFMLALQHTSSSNTAFIVQMSVIIVPLLMALYERRQLKGRVIVSALAALGGLFLLTCNFSGFRFNPGDLFALGNALFFSLFLAGQKICSKWMNPVHFSLVHHSTNTCGFLVLALFLDSGALHLSKLSSPTAAALTASCMIITVITIFLQSTAIKYVRPEKATLIYTLEPVTAMLFAALLINERPDGAKALAGCIIILLSVAYSVYRPAAGKTRTVIAKKTEYRQAS